MAGTLLGVNTTIKFSGTKSARFTSIGTSDQTLVNVGAGTFVIVSGVHVESLGTHTSYVVRFVPNGGTQFPVTATAATAVGTNILAIPIFMTPGDILEIAFTGGTNAFVGVVAIEFANSP